MNKSILPILILSGFAVVFSSSADIQYAGVNLSGAEFGDVIASGGALPGTYGSQYIYPNNTEVNYYQSKGMNIIRLPFRWERLQRTNNAAFNSAESNRLVSFVSYASGQGMHVILDPHNFQRYWPDISTFTTMQSGTVGVIGNSVVPNSAFSNFWYQVANISSFKNNPNVIFGLMNEPNALQQTQMIAAENAAIAGIRAAGASNLIFVPGNRWTGAWTWSQSDGYGTANSNAMLNLVDPANNYVVEVHQYLDTDGSGSNDGIVSTDIGWERLTNFTAWARAYNVKAFLGEYAVPGNTLGSAPNGGTALTNMLSYISTNADVWLGWTYWGGGPWWGSSPTFPIEPSNIGTSGQQDQPTMSIIKQFFPLPVPTLQLVNNNTQFQYPAPQGFVYQVQYSTDLTSSANWLNLGSAITNVASPGSVGTNAPFKVNLGSDPQGFYRVVVSHAP